MLKQLLSVGVMMFGITSTCPAMDAVEEKTEGEGKDPTLATVAPSATVPPMQVTPPRSIKDIEASLGGILSSFSVVHLQMMGIVPGWAGPSALTALLNQTIEVSTEAAARGSTLGRIGYRRVFDYYLLLRGKEDEESLRLKERLLKTDEQLTHLACAGKNPVAIKYLKSLGKLPEGAEEVLPVEDESTQLSVSLSAALSIVNAEGDWGAKTDEERFDALGKMVSTDLMKAVSIFACEGEWAKRTQEERDNAVNGLMIEADTRIWNLIVEALEPVAPDNLPALKRSMGLASKSPAYRHTLLQLIMAGNQRAKDLYTQAILGNFNGKAFGHLTTHLGVLNLPEEFDANIVSLTQTMQAPGFDRPVEANRILANRMQGLFTLALNGQKTAQEAILTPEPSSRKNMVQWWQGKRKAAQLRAIQEDKRLDDSAKAKTALEIESHYQQIEAQLLSFWDFVFPLVNIM